MGWTLPRTWRVGEIVTKALMDLHVKDNLRYLKGLDGVPTIESGLTIDNTDGDERILLPLLSTAECTSTLNAEGEVAHDETTHRIKVYDGTAVRSVVTTADVDDTPVNGATTDPVSSNWAYDFQQVLTTAGDLPYATGAGVWSRLGKGSSQQYLRQNAGLTAPEWAAAPAVSKVKAETRDMTAASGNVSYTGYGITPSALLIFAMRSGAGSFCTSDASKNYQSWIWETAFSLGTNYIVDLYAGATPDRQSAIVASYDADGFTLTWTKEGAPGAETAKLLVFAFV